MDPNQGILTTFGCDPSLLPTIPKLIPGIRIHLVMDQPQAEPRTDAQVNVFCAIEPPAIAPHIHHLLHDPEWCRKWDIIASNNPSEIADQKKARKYVLSPFWTDPYRPHVKEFGVSTIMSTKQWTEGHRLRHWLREKWAVTIPSKIFCSSLASCEPYPQDRRDCFKMMFHLTIENSRFPGYFTEKLLDSLRCKSVPIYWGDPNIGDIFDISGMILIGDMSGEQILHAISNLTADDYEKRKDAIDRNAEIAEKTCEGHNPFPVDEKIPPAMCYRLGKLLREAQESRITTD